MRNTLLAISLICWVPSVDAAQCGWVLWMEKELFTPSGGRLEREVEWELADTFDDAATCRSAQERTWKALYGKLQGPGVQEYSGSAPISLSQTFKTGGIYRQRILCVPSTIDPRPR